MNEKKISARAIGQKTIKDYLALSNVVLSAILSPARLCDRVAPLLSDPDFHSAEKPVDWLCRKLAAVISDHVSVLSTDSLVQTQIAFDLAAVMDMTVDEVMNEEESK